MATEETQNLSVMMLQSSALQATQDLSVAHLDGDVPLEDPVAADLPGYQVGEKIGQGAYGVVWAGTQATTQQKVAIKVLRSGPRHGLHREVQRILEVSEHPYVVPLLDARLEHEPAFLVTPLMQGSLGAYLRENCATREVESALIRVWMRQVASALDFVHTKGIVHCDLKPDNILLDNEGNCKVCDFGQATLSGEKGLSLGTFFFMPAEQTVLEQDDSHAKIEPTWDIYALGATFYFLATSVLARGNPESVEILRQERDPRKRLSLYREQLASNPLVPCQELNHGLDDELAQLIDRCLQLKPSDRFQSAGEVLQALVRPATNKRQGPSSLILRGETEYVRTKPISKVFMGLPLEPGELIGLLGWIVWLAIPLFALGFASAALWRAV